MSTLCCMTGNPFCVVTSFLVVLIAKHSHPSLRALSRFSRAAASAAASCSPFATRCGSNVGCSLARPSDSSARPKSTGLHGTPAPEADSLRLPCICTLPCVCTHPPCTVIHSAYNGIAGPWASCGASSHVLGICIEQSHASCESRGLSRRCQRQSTGLLCQGVLKATSHKLK